MPSLLTHPAVPLAVAAIAGRDLIPRPLLAAGIGFALLPDVDGVAFLLDIPWYSPFSHRGLTHSFAFALLCALLALPLAPKLGADRLRVFAFLALCMLSHGFLDACTDRGGGVALLWPLDSARISFDFRPIQTVPISLERLFSAEGSRVIKSELLWVWLPLSSLALLGRGLRAAFPHRWSAIQAALLRHSVRGRPAEAAADS
ncbi:MAG TPA: metal-dependent hydrolase [Gammaproteobacteria bacterium]|nr:metal-dependent hydrolase [Gammaproteobacteria bacterium]